MVKEEQRTEKDKRHVKNKMAKVNPSISMVTSNVNGLNAPVKRRRLSSWIKKQVQLYTVYKRHTLDSKTNSLKVRRY